MMAELLFCLYRSGFPFSLFLGRDVFSVALAFAQEDGRPSRQRSGIVEHDISRYKSSAL